MYWHYSPTCLELKSAVKPIHPARTIDIDASSELVEEIIEKNKGLLNHYLRWGYSKKMTHFVSIPYFIPACRKIVHRRFCKWCPRKFPWKSEKGKSARRMTESVIGDLALVVCRMSKPFWLTYLNMENTSDGVGQEKAWDQQFPSETVTEHPRDPTPVDDNTGNLQRVKDMTRE